MTKYVEYFWVGLLTILSIVLIGWIIYNPLNLFSELDALPVLVEQVEGTVVTDEGFQLSVGDTIQIGSTIQGTTPNSQLLLKLSNRSYVHFNGAFTVAFNRVEGYRLPIFQLHSGWMNFKRQVADIQVPAVVQTPAGFLAVSNDASSWLTHSFTDSYIVVSDDEVHILVPNGPLHWVEDAGSTTIRSGIYFVASASSANCMAVRNVENGPKPTFHESPPKRVS
jgi:hypothetical protein